MKNFDLFKNYVLGQHIEVSDNTNLYQCFDLATAYCMFLGVPKATISHLYAYQIFTYPNDLTTDYFQIIRNTDDFIPQEGDIGVFNKTDSNIAGHVCICTGEGSLTSFKSLDQNWAGQNKVVEVTHSYTNFLGVLRFKKTDEITDQTLLPIIDENGNNMEVGAVRSRLSDQSKQITDLKLTVQSLNNKITELENPPATVSTSTGSEVTATAQTGNEITATASTGIVLNNPYPDFYQRLVGFFKQLLGL